MTKKEINRAIVNRFLTFVEEEFPQYDIADDSGDGRISLYPSDEDGVGNIIDNIIEFHRSRLTLDSYNWASEQTKENIITMSVELEAIAKEYNI